jgi:opacity protein-like surface antigen
MNALPRYFFITAVALAGVTPALFAGPESLPDRSKDKNPVVEAANPPREGVSLYAALEFRASFDTLDSGGFNTAGAFPNTGSDEQTNLTIGGAMGLSIPLRFGALRVECEGISADMFNTVTNSFAPPTPTFFYRTDYSDRWAVLANAWYDIPLCKHFGVYGGGGVGGGGATMSVNDTVVQGRDSSTDFVWQAGGGITATYNRVTLDVGYRYMDWGKSSVNLTTIVGPTPAGNFTADVTSHQVFVALRYAFFTNLFSH